MQTNILDGLNLNFRYGEDLREVADEPSHIEEAINRIHLELEKSELEPRQRVKLLGLMGHYLRTTKKFEQALKVFDLGLKEVGESRLDEIYGLPIKIRYAHTLQWMGDYENANLHFENLIHACRINNDYSRYLDFALQHAGKNYFDQGKYKKAEKCFVEALDLRKTKGKPELIESTNLALIKTQEKIEELALNS